MSFKSLAVAPIYSSLRPVRDSGKYSDLVVTCKSQTFNAHRVVLCSQSEFFDKACGGPFIEASSGKIDLPDDDPALVQKLMDFFYTGDYTQTTKASDGCESKPTSRSPTVAHAAGGQKGAEVSDDTCSILFDEAKVYIMADKFIIPALKDISLERFRSAANRAEGMSSWQCDSFPLVADEIYNSTTRSDLALKEILCRLLVNKRGNKELWSSMQPVFRKHGDLATGVLNYWNGDYGTLKCPRCPRCAQVGNCDGVRKGSCYCRYCGNYHQHDSNAGISTNTEDWIQKEIGFISMKG
ncbi:hypothetical protein RB599_010967 [Gaeumannomyces hyphopodioides]